VLESLTALRLEIETFRNDKGEVVAKRSDEKWLRGQQKLISDMFVAVRGFEMKLKLFRKQMENVNLCNLSSCDLFLEDGSVNVRSQRVRAVEMIDSLAEKFKKRFNDFRNNATDMHIFENPFSVEVSDIREKLQLELTEL
jgi:hypothetical protein